MGGYLVKVKHLGKHYDIKVSDEEVDQKIEDFLQYNPNFNIDKEEVAEAIANEKAPFVLSLKQKQQWIRGECSICGAKHRLVNSSFSCGDVLLKNNFYVCEKCFEEEYLCCRKCNRDLPIKEIENGLCSLCRSSNINTYVKRAEI